MMKSVAAVVLLAAASEAFYLPGVAPRDFSKGETVELKVTALTSTATQLAYDYYDVPFCSPPEIVDTSENLGELMAGERMKNSAYEIFMMKQDTCKELCTKDLSAEQAKQFEDKIKERYMVNWVVDNIPAATIYEVVVTDEQGNTQFVPSDEALTATKGFELGSVGTDGKAYLNNHAKIVLDYHQEDSDMYRIVGFEVIPSSIDTNKAANAKCGGGSANIAGLAISGGAPVKVKFTYDVHWRESPVKWASRWDVYLKSVNSDIHWFAISNSIVLVLFITATVATILTRALKNDFDRYNIYIEVDDEDEEEKEEEMGWKQVHGDVFRTPDAAYLLPLLCGTGIQILTMAAITLALACAGVLSPANRGGLMTAFLVLYVVMGIPAGYVGARLYKMLGLEGWKRNALRIAYCFPGIAFGIFFLLNLVVWREQSLNAIPFTTLVALLCMWLGISLPLTLVGAYVGDRKPAIEQPVRVNHLARTVPQDVPWTFKSWIAVMLMGCVPFGAVYIEVYFVMSSVWEHQFYYMFGILALVFIVLIVVCAEVSIFYVYYCLASENYHWWWRAFLASGSSAIFLMIYAVRFYASLGMTKFVSTMLFFGYMTLASLGFFLMTGTIGFLATLLFVRKIYATIKID